MVDMRDMSSAVRGKRILVTGGMGFIGSHLVRKLTDLGGDVTVFDIVSGKSAGSLNPRYVQGDITSPNAVDRAMRNMDVVFHLSALLGVEVILKIPKEVLDVNLGGTLNALEAAVKNRVSRFILCSSSEVYGEPRRLPITEDDPTAPVSTYGVSKLAAEEYCIAYSLEHGLPTTRLRYFNVYGPGQKERFVIPIFISRVLLGKPPLIYGQGSQTRSYTFVDDAVEGTILAGFKEAGRNGVFNIGQSAPLPIVDLAKYIIELSGKEIVPVYKDFGDGIRLERREVLNRIPDITKAVNLLGYRPIVDWREGVKRYFDWYKASMLSKASVQSR